MLLKRIEIEYSSSIKNQVVSSIVRKDGRSDLLKATGFLVSHLLNAGHSRSFVKERVQSRFFAGPIKKTGPSVVGSFIESVSDGHGKYVVVCRVPSSTASLLRRFDGFDVQPFGALAPHAQGAVQAWPDHKATDMFIVGITTSADPYRAVDLTHERLGGIRALMMLPAKRPDISWGNMFYAYGLRSTNGRVIQRNELSLHTPMSGTLSGRRLRQVTNLPKQIDRDFDEGSRERLLSAVSTAAVALDAGSLETRLISLWSAFEVLLSDPPESEARIPHYVKHLAPCITWKYHRRIFSAVYDQLSVILRRKLKNLIEDIDVDQNSNQHTKFAKLIILPHFEEKRDFLLKTLADSPLALHRLYRLEKFYGTPSACANTMKDHQRRVEWQLHRIYRTRNNLVHAGRSPHYIDSLVLNAIEYFRNCVITISRFRRSESGIRDIDQIVSEIGFEAEILGKRLRSSKPDIFTDSLADEVFAAG